MQIIRFDLTTFEDIHSYGLTHILDELFNFMQTEIKKKKGSEEYNEQKTGKRTCRNCHKSLILSAGKCVYCGQQIVKQL